MAFLGANDEMLNRRVAELKLGGPYSAGIVLRLGSTSGYLQLGSATAGYVGQAVLEYDTTATGVEATDVLLGVEVRETKVNQHARVFVLSPGDIFRTNMLASGSDAGALDGTKVPGVDRLAIDPTTGKLRIKQAYDAVEFGLLAAEGGNLFNTDGSIWVEVVRLA